MAVLDLVWGVASSKALGNTGTTDNGAEPLNLLDGSSGIRLMTENARSGWTPSNPTLKNDGVRADSALENGTAILASAYGNVTETMQLYLTGANYAARAKALRDLYRFSAASLSWQNDTQSQPVYLRWQSDFAPAEQYSLVVKIDISFVDYDLMHTSDSPEVTMVVEREPFWRALPVMDNPKKWALNSRGLIPTTGTPAATEYNYTNLNLLSTFLGTASYRSLVESNIRNYDEIGTSNVNYIDIPASSLPGDAPALALVTWTAQANGVAGLWVARSTQRDYYSANNSNITTQRAKNTFNGGDITVPGAGTIGKAKNIDAAGLLSNGSIVNRYLYDLTFAAGAVNESVGSWQRVYAQYQNKYLAFIRTQVTAGVLSELSVSLEWKSGSLSSNIERTTAVGLKQSAFGLTYLGVVDLSKTTRRQGGVDGTGVDAVSTFTLTLYAAKVAGAVATVRIWDVILIPFDEVAAYMISADGTVSSGESIFIDKTGYFGQEEGALAYISSELLTRQMRGAAIELVPGVSNRLYTLADISAANIAVNHQIRVDIVPCWYGVRDL